MLAPPELKQVHPLGKSPVITVEAPGLDKPLVLAESAAIVEYLTDHFGPHLAPKRYREGMEGKVGGESEEWVRYRFFMHYAEGSLMALMMLALVLSNIKNAPVPFFIKPITRSIAQRVEDAFLTPNFATHFAFLEDQIASSAGDFLCGPNLTGADILMVFPLEAGGQRAGMTKEKYPKLAEYVARLQSREAYARARRKIEEATGEKFHASL